MNTLALSAGFNFEVLNIIIASSLASTAIAWWIWVVHCSLGQLRSHQIDFIDLIFECLRSLFVVLIILTLIAFF